MTIRRFKRKTRISARRRAQLRSKAKKIAYSIKAPMNAYHQLEKKIDKTWKKLRQDVKKRSRKAIGKGRSNLLLLLGECDYMARECARCMKRR